MRSKIGLVGERRVSKTSLLERYLQNYSSEECTGTLGGRVYPVELESALWARRCLRTKDESRPPFD